MQKMKGNKSSETKHAHYPETTIYTLAPPFLHHHPSTILFLTPFHQIFLRLFGTLYFACQYNTHLVQQHQWQRYYHLA
jgi:hypothetical protein